MISTKSNRGIALITVLFIVALITTLATSMLTRLARDLRRTEYNYYQGQMTHYMYGVESWAVGRLKQDTRNEIRNGKFDHENDTWNNKIVLEIVDNQANISASLQDLQSRFNLNNLAAKAADNSKDQNKPDKNVHYAYFKRLLQQLELETGIADPIADWVDSDHQTRFPNGAEDQIYLNLKPPYRTANKPMAGISELFLVKGITPEIVKKLQNHITALPQTTTINVNTASAEVIAALSPDISKTIARNIVEQRLIKPFKSTSEFISLALKLTKKQDLTPKNLNLLIGVSSSYFLCKSGITMPRGRIKFRSLINRNASSVNIIQRSRGLF